MWKRNSYDGKPLLKIPEKKLCSYIYFESVYVYSGSTYVYTSYVINRQETNVYITSTQ